MSELSHATQAVLTAFNKYPLHGDHIANNLMHGALPAALRAAALYCKQDGIRLLAIAGELENLGRL